jgi:hypothetical protein
MKLLHGMHASTAGNSAAAEFVYMIEADTQVWSGISLCKPGLAIKLLDKYKELINAIPAACFGDFGLRETMHVWYSGLKKGTANCF